MTNEALQTILKKHKMWLNNEAGGEHADLQDYADLQDADLRYADLRNANLLYTDLQSAYLQGADLRYADLRYADLRYANLQGANLQYANLQYANLRNADLQDAKNIPEHVEKQLNNLPKGKLIGYKKCRNDVIVTLEIPAKAKRSKSTKNKCRAEYAKVVAISDGATEATSTYVDDFKYVVGKTVKPDSWDNNWNNECSNGIHFFLTMEEAQSY